MSLEVKLSDTELDNSLFYLEEEGFSMYLPEQFEIDALRMSWDKIRPVLTKVNLLSYEPKPCLQLIAPKQKFAAMPIQLVDPVDMVLFTALGLRLAPSIEHHRALLGPSLVHSWRYSTTPDGKPRFSSDWNRLVEEVKNREARYSHVAKADIVDFFPRIYLHRLENALSSITRQEPETRALMRFLSKWSGGTSYGIPIGPRICGILAEALLSEVDEFLKSRGFDFVRYGDDYFFFANSSTDCLKALFSLAERLQDTQGLSLNMAKTRVQPTKILLQEFSHPSEKHAKQRQQVIDEVFKGDPYAELDYDRLSREQKKLVDELDLRTMLDEALKPDILDLPLVKFVLNVLAGLRRPELVEVVLSNLERLLPAAEAVARFLSIFAAADKRVRDGIGARILEYLLETSFVPHWYSLWLLEPFAQDPRWDHTARLRVIARDHGEILVRRQAILALGNIGDRSSLLDVKVVVGRANDWEWRAIVYACRSLPEDEKTAFWRTLSVGADWKIETVTSRATLEYAKSNSPKGP